MVCPLSGDERGVSEILGFVLAFSLVVTTFAIYQADVVPHQNRDTEFRHSQQMAGEFAQLRAAAESAAAENIERSAAAKIGTKYRQRPFAINPPPVTGRLRTTEPYDVEMSGFETPNSEFWSGIDTDSWETRLLRYRADYVRMQSSPTYALENGMTVKRFGGTSDGMILGGGVVEGDRIRLLLLGGDYEASGLSADVSFNPTSSATDPVPVTATSSATITMPTTLPKQVWEEAAGENGKITGVTYTQDGYDQGVHEVTIEVASGEYDFAVSKVSLASPTETEARFITAVGPTSRTMPADGVGTLRVTVRDAYGNPVSGAQVDLSWVAGSGSPLGTVTTDADGVASFSFDATSATGEIEAELDNGESVTFDLDPITGGDGSSMPVYTGGQLLPGVDDVKSLTLSDGRMVPNSDTNCLLVGDLGGILGGLVGEVNCGSTSFQSIQGTLSFETDAGEYTVEYLVVDWNNDGDVTDDDTGPSYCGLFSCDSKDDGVYIMSETPGGSIFEGKLTDSKASDVLGGSGADVLESSNYASSSGSIPDIPSTDTIFVEKADGRVTVTASDT